MHIDLTQNTALAFVDSIQLLVCGGTRFRIGRMDVTHQLVTSERPSLAIRFQLELQPIGEHRVDRQQSVLAIGVLEVDELFRRLV